MPNSNKDWEKLDDYFAPRKFYPGDVAILDKKEVVTLDSKPYETSPQWMIRDVGLVLVTESRLLPAYLVKISAEGIAKQVKSPTNLNMGMHCVNDDAPAFFPKLPYRATHDLQPITGEIFYSYVDSGQFVLISPAS